MPCPMEIEKQPIGSAAPNLADCPALLQRERSFGALSQVVSPFDLEPEIEHQPYIRSA